MHGCDRPRHRTQAARRGASRARSGAHGREGGATALSGCRARRRRFVRRRRGEGGRRSVLRFGSFYGPTARMIDEALRLARWRLSMMAGKPGGYVSSIHTDDVAGAAVAALDAPAGIYNAVEDEPVTRRDYLDAF